MTASVRVLTTLSVDSSPTLLIVSPDGSKTIVNCGEGCQRTFLEYTQKMSSVDRVCLTHLSHETVGGLPGMILSTADVAAAAMENARAALASKQAALASANNPRQASLPPVQELKPGLSIVGPTGSKAFVHSLRHFMRRDKFELHVHEGNYAQPRTKDMTKVSNKKKASRYSESFTVQSFAFEEVRSNVSCGSKRPRSDRTDEYMSFIFTSPPVLGKFLIEKAKALNVPRGPLYAQLKNGKDVTFVDAEGVERTVRSSEIVEPSLPGISVAVLCYPTAHVLEQIQKSDMLRPYKQQSNDHPVLDIIVHMTPARLFRSKEVTEWLGSFGAEIKHVFLETACSSGDKIEASDYGTPFHSAALGAIVRSRICSNIYCPPEVPTMEPFGGLNRSVSEDSVEVIAAKPLLEFVVLPRSRRGFSNTCSIDTCWQNGQVESNKLLKDSGALEHSAAILSKNPVAQKGKAEILFTGTGSALPCKHRNVSGIYVRMDNGNAILLDVGEGTTGQILRAKHNERADSIIAGIKAVWISHPHADHHLGILRLLAERQKVQPEHPLVLIAPINMFRFLREYEEVDPSIAQTYRFMNCEALVDGMSLMARHESHDELLDQLDKDLGIQSLGAIPVAHCNNAYAVVLRCPSFGTLSYSGDCRPSTAFANMAKNSDILIHEATFEDGMEAEAAVKRHSTIGEALSIAETMNAKAIILTHFSQRYPRIPPLKEEASEDAPQRPVVFAFDYVSITPGNLMAASKLTPALRLLYPEEECPPESDEVALAALNTPGLFAQPEIL